VLWRRSDYAALGRVTAYRKDFPPHVAAKLDVVQNSDIAAVDFAYTLDRTVALVFIL